MHATLHHFIKDVQVGGRAPEFISVEPFKREAEINSYKSFCFYISFLGVLPAAQHFDSGAADVQCHANSLPADETHSQHESTALLLKNNGPTTVRLQHLLQLLFYDFPFKHEHETLHASSKPLRLPIHNFLSIRASLLITI